jgi:nicotinamidase-related amidase
VLLTSHVGKADLHVLGYTVTLVKDATAALSKEHMRGAVELERPDLR